jgi:hypothetical protein
VTTPDDLEARVRVLEARVTELADHLALYQTMATYGPAVDSLSIDEATSIWLEDGVYDGTSRRPSDMAGATPPGLQVSAMHGRAEIAAMLHGDLHRTLVRDGCAHVMSLPLIRIDGDRAVGVGYHFLYVKGDDGFKIWRMTASRWDWLRTGEGWKVETRTHRLIDGSDDARELLATSLRDIQAGS